MKKAPVVIMVTDARRDRMATSMVELQGVAAMALNPALAHDSRGSKRFRLIAPLLVTLGLAAAGIAPGILLG